MTGQNSGESEKWGNENFQFFLKKCPSVSFDQKNRGVSKSDPQFLDGRILSGHFILFYTYKAAWHRPSFVC